MDFSLVTMFVLQPGNTAPATTGSTEDLPSAKFGVYNADWSVSTAGNIAAQPYIYLAQGRKENTPGQTTKRSDKISSNPLKIKKWYKTVAQPVVPNQSTVVSNFSVSCGEEVSVTIRALSNYIDVGFFNGLTRSVTVKAPCCDCGADPCVDVDPQALVDQVIAEFKKDEIVSHYIDLYRVGTGTSSQLVIVGKPLDAEGRICSDISANLPEYDRLWFRVFVYKGADTTADFLVPDKCDNVADIAVTSRALYALGTSDQILTLEQRYYSYQTSQFKHLFRNTGYNGAYESLVVDGQFYDTYVLIYRPYDVDYDWQDYVAQDAEVIIAVPTGEGDDLEDLLTVYLGAPKEITGVARTTTTSTSTTSTSTTSTTTLQP